MMRIMRDAITSSLTDLATALALLALCVAGSVGAAERTVVLEHWTNFR